MCVYGEREGGGREGAGERERDLRSGVDMADIGGDTRSCGNIVERKLRNERVKFHKKGEWLTDAAGGAQDGYFTMWS